MDCFAARANGALPLIAVNEKTLARTARERGAEAWVKATGFKARAGDLLLLPAADGRLAGALVGAEDAGGIWTYAAVQSRLPAGRWRIEAALDRAAAHRVALGWALGAYSFERYRKPAGERPELVLPKKADRAAVEAEAAAIYHARDLINTPAQDLPPSKLAEAVQEIGRSRGAQVRVVVGEALLAENYPSIHTVGRAAADAPRLADLTWGRPGDPKVTIIGKGVCFDSGGLDIKSSAAMKMMKKDMGGAAAAIALARMVMDAGLKLRLRLMIPAVENAIAGNAFHPLDVIRTRKGLTVEVGNTDAEGRLILCDALAEADAEKPAMILDFATLTGAARVALGPELPALFSNSDALADALLAQGRAQDDPLWRLPLHPGYRGYLDSKVADMSSTGDSPFAGSITAALYLERFVSDTTPWAHIDTFGWNAKARPGRPEGGEALAVRAAFAMLKDRFGGR
ncbi:MAG: leucyl aminopeptidase family protein [Thalassobaculales bacterium]